jgi:hypothetical protein
VREGKCEVCARVVYGGKLRLVRHLPPIPFRYLFPSFALDPSTDIKYFQKTPSPRQYR